MLRSAARKVVWATKGAALFGGAVVTLALLFGAASVALAGTGVGARFNLGKVNAVDAISTLTGTVDGPTLRLENGAENRLATALDLRVAHEGITPMRTNSTQTVPNLSADSVDGRDAASFAEGTGGKANDADRLDGKDSGDFLPKDVYTVEAQGFGGGDGLVVTKAARCDPGDRVLGGGGGTAGGEAPIFSAASTNGSNGTEVWAVQVRDNAPASFVIARAICADLPPLRP